MSIQDDMFEAMKCRYDDLVELNKATVAENEKLRAKIEDYRTELICMWCEWVKEDEEALRELQRLGQEWDNDDAEQRHGANVADQRHGGDDE